MARIVDQYIEIAKKRNPGEPEFIQTVEEVLTSLEPAIEKHPEYEANKLLERLVEPERIISFRVVWMDDEGTDYPVSEELTTAFFEMLFRNCDGKGTIEDSVMVYVKLDNEGNISEDMANRWYLMVTQSDILQWISQLREEYHEENIQ